MEYRLKPSAAWELLKALRAVIEAHYDDMSVSLQNQVIEALESAYDCDYDDIQDEE